MYKTYAMCKALCTRYLHGGIQSLVCNSLPQTYMILHVVVCMRRTLMLCRTITFQICKSDVQELYGISTLTWHPWKMIIFVWHTQVSS